MKEFIIRDTSGEINVDQSLEKFKDMLLSKKQNEIPSSKISDEIDNVFNSHDNQLSLNFILTQVCSKIDYKVEDHNKLVEKIKTVLKNKVEEKTLKFKAGKGGGFSK